MTVRQLTYTALFAALCAIGGLVKIPLGISSTALDAAPALVAAAFLSPALVGVSGLLGHLASALYGGFPLGPFHLLVAVEMLVILMIFARLHKAGKTWRKWAFFIIANGLLAPLPFYFLLSPAFFIGVLPGIFIATVCNAVVAALVLPFLADPKGRRIA